jgi:hypothetical protein
LSKSVNTLPLPYFGNLFFYAVLFQTDHIIDVHENYRKQTYKNRAEIVTDQGLLKLTIPVIKNSGLKTPFHEIQIDNGDHWNKIHPRALKAAYSSSPFYEYYIDDLNPIWEQPCDSLYENNLRCHKIICKIMEWKLDLNISDTYVDDFENDYRPMFLKRKKKSDFQPYTQVFKSKTEHISNLSILDLIFNLGPESEMYLRNLKIE